MIRVSANRPSIWLRRATAARRRSRQRHRQPDQRYDANLHVRQHR
ncbi:hypothetical protein [Vibrio gallaecicus]|nr:hypothetical protein [Vibrio gallaecicus]MDN3613987.1 hypothetical protein [Vibrio gallaecicus]